MRAQGAGPEAKAALENLLAEYFAYVVFLMRVNDHPPDSTARDLAQEYVLGVVRRNDVAKLDQSRGSFRAWLRRSVRNFLCNEWDRWHRRPQIDTGLYEAFHCSTPEDDVCDRAFLAHVLERALALTRAQSSDKQRFDRIARYLPGGGDLGELGDVTALARQLGDTPAALTKYIHDTRRRFERHVDATLWETLDFSDERGDKPERPGTKAALQALEEEKRALLRSLDPPGGGVLPVHE